MKNSIFALLVFATVVSCSTIANTAGKLGKTQPSIVNTKWVVADAVKGKTPTLSIENGRVTGNAGCNNYFGELFLDTTAGNFTASKIGTTKMMCDQISVEENFLKVLSETNKYLLNGDTLELYKDKLLLLKLVKQGL